ncbi:hypothetical protein [Ferrimicrobium sp.]|nr:hypothetical protein [Ferrimicrobium sp.]
MALLDRAQHDESWSKIRGLTRAFAMSESSGILHDRAINGMGV